MHRPDPGRLLTVGAGLLAIVGAVLPYYSFPSGATATVWSRGLFPTATIAVVLCVVLGIEAAAELAAGRGLPSPLLNFSWEQVRLVCGTFATVLALAYLVQGRAGADLGAGYSLVAAASVVLLAGGVLSRRRELAQAPRRSRRVEVAADVEAAGVVADDDWLDDPELLALLADDGESATVTPVTPMTPMAPVADPVEREPEPAAEPVAATEIAPVATAPVPEPGSEPEAAPVAATELVPVATATVHEPEPEPAPAPEPEPEPEPDREPAAPSISLAVVPAAGNGTATPRKRTPRKATASRKTTATRKATTRKSTTRKATSTRKATPTRTRRRTAKRSDGEHGEEPDHDAQPEQPDADPAQHDAGDGHASPGDGAT
jgi:hypothetical protein